MWKIKNRIYPEDITINIGKGTKIPEIPDFLNGHKWGEIINNPYGHVIMYDYSSHKKNLVMGIIMVNSVCNKINYDSNDNLKKNKH